MTYEKIFGEWTSRHCSKSPGSTPAILSLTVKINWFNAALNDTVLHEFRRAEKHRCYTLILFIEACSSENPSQELSDNRSVHQPFEPSYLPQVFNIHVTAYICVYTCMFILHFLQSFTWLQQITSKSLVLLMMF